MINISQVKSPLSLFNPIVRAFRVQVMMLCWRQMETGDPWKDLPNIIACPDQNVCNYKSIVLTEYLMTLFKTFVAGIDFESVT